jgi:all-trans-8'-apo-beta-carotenal 15,15'-oxygenase
MSTEAQVQGEIPADLKGTLLRNGPGNFDVGPGQKIQHPFDGDGVIQSYSFNEGQVVMRRKFVRTAAQREEMTAGAMLKL